MFVRQRCPRIAAESQRIAAGRVALALFMLVCAVFVPAATPRFSLFGEAAFVAYVLYSLVLYILARLDRPRPDFAVLVFIDLAWYSLLHYHTGGSASPYFLCYFFPIFAASIQGGYVAGWRWAGVCAVYYTLVSALAGLIGDDGIEPRSFTLRLIGLLLLGYLIASYGDNELKLRGRFALLEEITRLSNPRFGVARLIGSFMRRLIELFQADHCLLLIGSAGGAGCQIYRASRYHPEKEMRSEPASPQLAEALLALPPQLAVVYCNRHARRWWWLHPFYYSFDLAEGKSSAQAREESEDLLTTLDANSFISVPVIRHGKPIGRLYLSGRDCSFDDSDIHFTLQLIEHVLPLIDNIRLVDKLATSAAEEERRKIARDIHDSVIQPYIGLQLGLSGVRQKLLGGRRDVVDDVTGLIDITEFEVGKLRQFMRDLNDGGQRVESLVPALRRFAAKFKSATRISVEIVAAETLSINDRLAAEVFQMVAEGLSNIRRHTTSERVTVELARRNNSLSLRIGNEAANGAAPRSFTPRSITERARSLGGQTAVEHTHDHQTIVNVIIPL